MIPLIISNKSDMTEVIYTLQSEKNTIDGKIGSICIEDDFNSHLKRILFIDTQNLFLYIFLSSLCIFFELDDLNSYLV